MRLLFSITYYTPYVSGLTLYVKKLAEALVKTGYKATVLSMQHSRDTASEEKIDGVSVVRAKPLFAINKGFISYDFLIKSHHLVKETDCVVINLPQFEGFIAALWAGIFNKKIIAVYHFEVVMPAGIGNKLAEIALNAANILTLLFAESIVTYTEDFARNSAILPYFRKKIRIVYPPISVSKPDKRVQNLIIDKTQTSGKFIIGVAARLAAEKGMEYLLESIPLINSKLKVPASAAPPAKPMAMHGKARAGRQMSKLKGKIDRKNIPVFKIIIAGSMDPAGEEKYKSKILKLLSKYRRYVVFLGNLEEKDMGSFYSLLDVLVLPSINRTEAFGMVQAEAMLSGVPVVATDLPGVRIPVNTTGMGIIVPVKNPQKTADAIARILVNREKYVKEKLKIRDIFNISKTIKFYKELIAV